MENIINLLPRYHLDKKGCCSVCRKKPKPTKRKGFLYCPGYKSYFSTVTGQRVPDCNDYGKDGELLKGVIV